MSNSLSVDGAGPTRGRRRPIRRSRRGPFATTLCAYDSLVAAVSAGDAAVGAVLAGLVELSHGATAAVMVDEIPGLVDDLATRLQLPEIQRAAMPKALLTGLAPSTDRSAVTRRLVRGLRTLQQRDGALDADALDRMTIEAFLRGVTAPAGTTGARPIGPQLDDYRRADDPAATPDKKRPDPRWVKVGSLERLDKLTVAVLQQEFPYFCVTRNDRTAFTGLDEVVATDDPYLGAAVKGLQTAPNSVGFGPVGAPVGGQPDSYLVDIVNDRPDTHSEEFRFGRDVSSYQTALVEYGGIGDPGSTINALLDAARQALDDAAPALKAKAAAAAKAAVEAAFPLGGSLVSGLAEGLVEALVGYGINLVLGLTDLGTQFPAVVVTHITVYASGGPPLSTVTASLLTGNGAQTTATVLELARLLDLGNGRTRLIDPARQETERSTRWWLGASAPAEPIGRSLGSFADRPATAWRNAQRVTGASTRGRLRRRGVILAGGPADGFAFRGFGLVARLPAPAGSAVYTVAVRADTRLVDGSDIDLTEPG
jgi:hypothetical protein